ncbi:MAG: D-alanyl-D-alanine carboxypeptidase [Clostridia bacterium]|nr:D-alanyl-D-alanine carboxypeptidase [Clostridia bacterium]
MSKKSGLQIKRLAALAVLILLTVTLIPALALPLSAADATPPTPPAVSGGEAIVLYDKTHGRYLVELNGADMLHTSTSAKIMTGLLACELLADRTQETVAITEEMLSAVAGYNMKLQAGEQIKIIDLLYGAICGSYNDAAYALAHLCGGSTDGFVALMNEKALSLGAKATVYTNPLGYPDSAGMITTAYDTLKIALAASENPLYMEISSAVKYTASTTNRSDARQFYNRNYLISSAADPRYYNASCAGMNAGYSGEAGGWSVVTLAHDDGADYICVLLGGKENEDGSRIYAYESVNTLVNWAKKTYNLYTVFPEGAQLGTTEIGLTSLAENDAPYITASALEVYVPTTVSGSLSYSIDIDEDLKAPLSAGDEIGRVTVTSYGEIVGTCPLLLKEDYEVNGVMLVIDRIGAYTKSRAFVATIVCFVLLLAGTLLYRRLTRYESHGRYTRKM